MRDTYMKWNRSTFSFKILAAVLVATLAAIGVFRYKYRSLPKVSEKKTMSILIHGTFNAGLGLLNIFDIFNDSVDKTKYGTIVTETGGLVTSRFDYLPPKTTLDFITVEKNAPVYRSIFPKNLEHEISADWESSD